MALRWTEKQRKIYAFLKTGKSQKEIVAEGFKRQTVRDVQRAVARGDTPETPPKTPKTAQPGEPLFEATTKGERVSLDPIVLVRYDSVRHALGWGKEDYSLGHFIDEATDIVTQLVGAIPPGFTKTEPKEAEVALATAVRGAEGGK